MTGSRSAGSLLVIIAAIVIFAVLWASGAFKAAAGNITCKKQAGQQYELCITGQQYPVYVPYSTWRAARVGGYYDESTHHVFGSVDDDPHAPRGVFGGGDDPHGFSGGGDGGR
jgi:hypothetical protein